MPDKNLEVPKPTATDAAHAVVRAGLGAVPFAGAAAAELFSAIVSPPIERRRTEWMERVGIALKELEERAGVNLEALQGNEVFIDAVLQASQVALRNNQTEKLESLKNAILNSALPNPPEESLQQIYLNFIDTLTVWHLKLMDLFQHPAKWAERNNHRFPNISMGGRSTFVENGFPELRNRRTFYDQIWKDLYLKGLVTTDSLHVTMSGTGLWESATSKLGNDFLKFIANPLEG